MAVLEAELVRSPVAVSTTIPGRILSLTSPCPVMPETATLYEGPVPVIVPVSVPLTVEPVNVMSAEVKPVTAWLKVMVKLIGEVLVGEVWAAAREAVTLSPEPPPPLVADRPLKRHFRTLAALMARWRLRSSSVILFIGASIAPITVVCQGLSPKGRLTYLRGIWQLRSARVIAKIAMLRVRATNSS